ncbi:MAG TPA: hypothetical protein VL463_28140 [Kofleriaceae bacterium]|nr:hypothetical protein [Kofleriaceae bacterium]
MRSALVLTTVLAVAAAAPSAARADVGLGLFVGEPFGLDVKIDLQRRSALDLVLGFSDVRDGRGHYGHLTYLVTPVVGRGRSINVPLRLGIGVAVFDGGGRFGDNVDVAVRAPLEIGLMFKSAPLELYGEITLLVPFVRDGVYADLDGGIGFRIYF